MSARGTTIQLAAKTAMLIAALFVVTVLLAAIPEHKGQIEATPEQIGDLQTHVSSDTDPQVVVVRASSDAVHEQGQNSATGSQGAASPDEKATSRQRFTI